MTTIIQKNELSQTTVLVIGGSSGIGLGIANALAEKKARVIVLSRTPPVDSSLEWRHIDLSLPDESRRQLQSVVNEFGAELDAVFYSAIYYGAKRAPFLQIKEEEWRYQLNVNLHGLWLSLSLMLPALMQRAPSLFVHISSEVVYNAGPGRSGYAATKAAGSNLIRSLAEEDPASHVRLVQLLPAKMVDTAGIRLRRPSGFDFSNYMKPEHFQSIAVQLVQTRGEGQHGNSLVVDETGQVWHADDIIPSSQSQHRG